VGTVLGIVIAVIVIVVIVAVAFFVMQRRRAERERASAQLRGRFGSEYDRAVQEYGSTDTAESMLRSREERVQKLDIRPLGESERARFANSWQSVQAKFVDDPPGAVGDADGLVRQVMEARGYPVGDFEQQASNVSVDHPDVVENYRAGHRIALAQQGGQAGTEDLRQAMVHYRALFQELLGDT
jgi:type II secretory pathway pseudopilin PulG